LDLDPTLKYSIQISDVSVSELDNILGHTFAGTLQVKQRPTTTNVSISLSGASKQDILDAINATI